jgi:2,4-dienoyl-CoA reductase-like NADH-dependent reductase (Old Yellow Enzyme family)
MQPAFPHLFSPIEIGGIEIRNRLFNPPHGTSLGQNGLAGEDLIAYHAIRARGGVGLIVLEGMCLHPTHAFSSGYLLATSDDIIPGFRELADRCHGHGARVFGQLFHAGRAIRMTHDGSRPRVYSASDTPDERYRVVPVPMSRALIRDVVDGYAAAARRLEEAGLDGIEILASMGYLVCQFLNPRVNRRTDEYGGSFENRLRLLREIVAAIRAATSRRMALGIRISADEKADDGLTAEEMLAVTAAIDGDGAIDYVSVTTGSSATPGGWIHVFPPMAIPQGYVAPQAAAIRQAIKSPVLVAGRINQPQMAEAVLSAGQADMVGMVRALITDPDLPDKARTGRSDDIRACIGCNQACVGHRLALHGISCIQNPVTGREARYGDPQPARVARRIMVIGGGPAGMKAAVTAAQRGHAVTLYERERQLGGQVLLAQSLPGRAEFGGVVTNLKRELELAGVAVHTGTAPTPAAIATDAPDAVIVATGARPRLRANGQDGDGHIVHAWSVLNGEANVGSRVAIADWACDWVGLGLAEKLARDGCHVRLLSGGAVAGEAIQAIVRDQWIGELHRLGVEMIPFASFFDADADTAYFRHLTSGEPIVCEGVDTVVLNDALSADTTVEQGLGDFGGDLIVVGDAAQPRTVEEAVLEGFRAGLDV